jgi:hypothetical protein
MPARQLKLYKSKIYKITSAQTTNVYVGSTCKSIEKRFYTHKAQYKCHKKGGSAIYNTSFKILQFPDAIITLIENYPCQTKAQLRRREGYWIQNTPNTVNRLVAGRTREETLKAHFASDKCSKTRAAYMKSDGYKRRVIDKHQCDCGGSYSLATQHKHNESKRHQLYVASQEQTDDEC